ncbi:MULTISPECIES: glycosyltransferase family 1 protein [unclassified Synechococcus]|uniref:glycosyltransferase family 4 protein n=1 Tax=unclassified Synechococcus TaxID=2626047 RepID=UPI00067FD9FE|nr:MULTISPECIES: glycosyltransferase family 1 protein [unclassified Synechococcus]WFN59515.1 glycosyltransferase family 1 protein [Synechococcus sp. CCFWC 502]
MNLIFDTEILGQAHGRPLNRGGIFRYSSELLLALHCQGDCALTPYCPEPLFKAAADMELQALGLIPGQPVSASGATASRGMLSSPGWIKPALKHGYRLFSRLPQIKGWRRRRFAELLQSITAENVVYHTPFYGLPDEIRDQAGMPVFITVHDMLPLTQPRFFAQEAIRHFAAMMKRLRATDHVVCVSQATRQDFLSHQHVVPESNVHVTPLAASPSLAAVRDPGVLLAARSRYGIPEHSSILLSLCTLEPRKNLITLIEAYEAMVSKLPATACVLVLAGSLGWKTSPLMERISQSSAQGSIIITDHVAESDLAVLYSLADAFVYPSLYEGFGLPPLEAMQCGTPVIVGHTSSLPEVVGDAALFVDPHSSAELRMAMERLLASPSLRQTMAQRSIQQASRFSWSHTAHLTTQIYRKVLPS